MDQYQKAVEALGAFMQGMIWPRTTGSLQPERDAARIAYVKNFKEVQRLKTQLDQYTDLDEQQQAAIETICPGKPCRSSEALIGNGKTTTENTTKEGEDAPDDIQQLGFRICAFCLGCD